MNFKKLLCMVLALMLALGTLALAESGDLQAQLDAANARIAELEAEVEKYKPVYDSQIVAEYGDGKVVMLADAQEQFKEISAIYAQYGFQIDSFVDEVKQDILTNTVEEAVKEAKIAELGLDQLDDQTRADLEAKTDEDWNGYVEYVMSRITDENMTDEEKRAAAEEQLLSNGYNRDTMLDSRIAEYASEKLMAEVTKDVAVTDADVEAAYQEQLAADQEQYADDDYSYNSARNSGELIVWNPEGYRAVKHVLIKFNDDQSARYTELNAALEALNDELEALDTPDESDPEAEPGETPEPTEVPRAREEIQADIGKTGAAIEALYAELTPKAQEVIDAFNNGAQFDDLIAQYGEDPGMTSEPTASKGYAVSKDSTMWDPAFTEGAMSIAEVGQISQPVQGSYGVHIIYYMSDITPGAVALDEVREAITESALESKKEETFDNTVQSWVEASHPVYHLDRFVG